jgi:alkanesulfonate monooxygenase
MFSISPIALNAKKSLLLPAISRLLDMLRSQRYLAPKRSLSWTGAAMPLRFHWSLSSAGERLRGARSRAAMAGTPDLAAHVRFCQLAEQCGIESLLTAFGFHRPDPIALAAALGGATRTIKFMVACRSGVCSPALFVQQVNTVAALTGGRISINVVAGHSPHEHHTYGDFLDHDERYARSDEFWKVCAAFWRREGSVDFAGRYYRVEGGCLNTPFATAGRAAPEIYVGGNSEQAERLAVRHASCLLRLPEAPQVMRPRVQALRRQGIEVGLLVSMIAGLSRGEALAAARELVAESGEGARKVHSEFARRSDSVAFRSTYALAKSAPEWLTPYLWTGAVPVLGAPAISLVGGPEEIAEALFAYREVGVTQFLFMGWPDDEAMSFFAREILPLVRHREQKEGAA